MKRILLPAGPAGGYLLRVYHEANFVRNPPQGEVRPPRFAQRVVDPLEHDHTSSAMTPTDLSDASGAQTFAVRPFLELAGDCTKPVSGSASPANSARAGTIDPWERGKGKEGRR